MNLFFPWINSPGRSEYWNKKDWNGRAGETLENYDVICGNTRLDHNVCTKTNKTRSTWRDGNAYFNLRSEYSTKTHYIDNIQSSRSGYDFNTITTSNPQNLAFWPWLHCLLFHRFSSFSCHKSTMKSAILQQIYWTLKSMLFCVQTPSKANVFYPYIIWIRQH